MLHRIIIFTTKPNDNCTACVDFSLTRVVTGTSGQLISSFKSLCQFSSQIFQQNLNYVIYKSNMQEVYVMMYGIEEHKIIWFITKNGSDDDYFTTYMNTSQSVHQELLKRYLQLSETQGDLGDGLKSITAQLQEEYLQLLKQL